jgi:hypothetical protein
MFRKHWREPGFWRWWWANQAPSGAKVLLAALALAAFLAVGFLAAVSLSEANTGRIASAGVTYETTVEKLVTVREHGQVVTKRVPVVRRIVLQPRTVMETVFGTRVITTKGRVQYVPTVELRKRVVTVNGQTRTISETRTVATTRTRTQTQTRTEMQTHTATQTETSVVTQEQTVMRTETVPTTVRETVTDTVPTTVRETVTETVPVTVTITITHTSP